MPSRMLREGILDSRAVSSLSEEAQLFYRCLMSVVDDFGRYEADPAVLRPRCFPRQLDQWPEERIARCLRECSLTPMDDGFPLVFVYTLEFKQYLEINRFGQRIRPNGKSKYPPPSAREALNLRIAGRHAHQSAAECGQPQHHPANGGEPPLLAASRARTTADAAATAQATAESEAGKIQPPAQVHVMPVPVANGSAERLPPIAGQSEYPLTLAEIRKHDPAADAHFTRRLMQEIVQKALSSSRFPRDALNEITDEAVARCVAESYRTGPKNHGVGLLLSRVPNIVETWALEE